jgi:hypothetical protein
MKMYKGVYVQIHILLNLLLDREGGMTPEPVRRLLRIIPRPIQELDSRANPLMQLVTSG